MKIKATLVYFVEVEIDENIVLKGDLCEKANEKLMAGEIKGPFVYACDKKELEDIICR